MLGENQSATRWEDPFHRKSDHDNVSINYVFAYVGIFNFLYYKYFTYIKYYFIILLYII